ncbi:MAG: sodium:solute symporter family protein [Pseudomonadota bacterium]
MNAVLIGVFVYILAQLLIGVLVSRRIKTEADYLLAGRSLGYGLATFSIFATWFGAETCMGAAGRVYDEGLSGGAADPFGYGLCLILMGLFFAIPLWRRGFTTLADLFRARYSPGVERIAVLMMVPTSVMWAAAQIRAFGQVLSASSELGVAIAITIAALVVIIYTVYGGLRADAVTDLVQGIVLIVGLVIIFVVFTHNIGGVEALGQAIKPERLNLFGGQDASLLATLEKWAVPTLGSVVAQEMVARILATRSPAIAQRATLLGGGLYLLVGLIPVTIGLAAFSVMPGVSDGEQILPLIAQQQLPTILYILFAGALISAILSTVDSALLAAGALASHNLIVPLWPRVTEQTKVRIARVGVIVFGVIAYVLALSADGIYELVADASAFGGAGIFIIVVFGLFTRCGGAQSAYAALAAGALVWFYGEYVGELPYTYLGSLAAALLAYLLFAFTQSPQRAATPT